MVWAYFRSFRKTQQTVCLEALAAAADFSKLQSSSSGSLTRLPLGVLVNASRYALARQHQRLPWCQQQQSFDGCIQCLVLRFVRVNSHQSDCHRDWVADECSVRGVRWPAKTHSRREARREAPPFQQPGARRPMLIFSQRTFVLDCKYVQPEISQYTLLSSCADPRMSMSSSIAARTVTPTWCVLQAGRRGVLGCFLTVAKPNSSSV